MSQTRTVGRHSQDEGEGTRQQLGPLGPLEGHWLLGTQRATAGSASLMGEVGEHIWQGQVGDSCSPSLRKEARNELQMGAGLFV